MIYRPKTEKPEEIAKILHSLQSSYEEVIYNRDTNTIYCYYPRKK